VNSWCKHETGEVGVSKGGQWWGGAIIEEEA
jgi:hypothetical protein